LEASSFMDYLYGAFQSAPGGEYAYGSGGAMAVSKSNRHPWW